jgi:hypothetical protein
MHMYLKASQKYSSHEPAPLTWHNVALRLKLNMHFLMSSCLLHSRGFPTGAGQQTLLCRRR